MYQFLLEIAVDTRSISSKASLNCTEAKMREGGENKNEFVLHLGRTPDKWTT